jgi:hypothetical protein
MTRIRDCIHRFDAHHRVALSLMILLIVFAAAPSLRLAVRAGEASRTVSIAAVYVLERKAG